MGALNYASSFGYQWNRFKFEQLDSSNGRDHSRKRFFSETGLAEAQLGGKWVLEAGCGAGRFLDVASTFPCELVGVDLSDAVDAAAATMSGRPNVHLVQASIYELPFKDACFDVCYSIGVIQHTPDPAGALRSLPRVVKTGGRVAVTLYERRRWTLWNAKYIVRPLTRRLSPGLLLSLIRLIMPAAFPVTDFLYRIPGLGRLAAFIIPVADYTRQPGLSFRQRYRCAVLDTFDMLSPRYDQPQTEQEAREALDAAGVSGLRRLSPAGLNLVGEKT